MNKYCRGAYFAPILLLPFGLLASGCGGSGSNTSAALNATPISAGVSMNPNTSWKSFSIRSMPIVLPQNVNNNGDVAGVDATGHSAIYLANRTLVLLKGAVNNNAPDGWGAEVCINDLGHVIARSADGKHALYYSSPTADPVQLADPPSTYATNLPMTINNNDQILTFGTDNKLASLGLYYSSPTSAPKAFGTLYQPVGLSTAGMTVGYYTPNTYSRYYFEQNVNGGSGKELDPQSQKYESNINISPNGYIVYQLDNLHSVLISPSNVKKTIYPSGFVAGVNDLGDFISGGSHLYNPSKGLFDLMSFLPSNTPWNHVLGAWMNDQGIVVGTANYNATPCGYIAQLPTGYY